MLETGSGGTAGPAFRFTRNITLLPHREAAWTVIQGELDALAETAEDLSEDGAYPEEVRARLSLMHENLGPDRARLRPGDGHRGRAVSLVLEFQGWCSLRLPTDPDPSDEPRGVSGYTFAFAGEPDFDRVLNLQPRPGMSIRSHSPELGVKVTRASAKAVQGRAGRSARRPDHREPQLDADAAGLRADRAVPAAGRPATASRWSGPRR